MNFTRKRHTNRWLILAVAALLAAAAAAAGVSLSWFVLNNSLSTVAGIQKPAEIEILGPNASQMAQIDLSYTEDEKDSSGNVTIFRPFTVRTDGNYYLYLARTTNIDDLDIQLYPAVEIAENDTNTVSVVSGVTDGNNAYNWTVDGAAQTENGTLDMSGCADSDLFKQKTYLNKLEQSGNDKNPIAEKTLADGTAGELYKASFHDYGSKEGDASTADNDGARVQKNAAPLYCVFPLQTVNTSTGSKVNKNYILRLSWQETGKETDILYLIAKNTANTAGKN